MLALKKEAIGSSWMINIAIRVIVNELQRFYPTILQLSHHFTIKPALSLLVAYWKIINPSKSVI